MQSVRLFKRPERSWLSDVRLWSVVAFLGYTLFGFLGVPRILRSQIPRLTRTYLGREASLRSVSFNPFTLVTILRGFELRDKDGTPLATFDELRVNLEISGLFRRAWTLREIHLLRPHVVGRILGDGRPAVADLLERKAEPRQPEEEFHLPRLLVRDLRIESGRVEFQDESTNPRFTTILEPLTVRVSDISTVPDQSGDHVVTVGIEDGGEVRWSGRMSVEPLRLEGKVELVLKRLDRLWAYVGQAYPIQLTSGEAHLSLPYLLERSTGSVMRAEAHDVTFDISGVSARPRDGDGDWLRLGRLDLKGGRIRWPEKTAEAELVQIATPAVSVWRSEDGTINWMGLMERLSRPDAATGSPRDSSAGWKVSCAGVQIDGGSVDIVDRTVVPAVTILLSGIDAHAESLTSDGSVPVKAHLSASANGPGRVSAAGTVQMSPLMADVDVEATGLELPAFQSYASQVARVQLQSGAAGIRGKASYHEGAKPLARFEGQATLDRLSLADPDGVRVLSWDQLAAANIRVGLEPSSVRMGTVDVRNPFAQIRIDRQGQIGALKLFEPLASSSSPEAAATPFRSAPFPVPLEIGSIRVHGGKFDYADQSLILPFASEISAAEGSVTDLSSKGSAGSRLLLEGTVGEHGYAKAEGTLRVFDPYASSKIRVLFRNVEMNPLTPYTVEFAGYSIKEGRLDLEVEYEIHERVLVGNHKLTATQLTIGDKVEGAKASLPLRLAVALLKDSQGRIELDVPIEGSVDDPEFAYRKVIWGALKRILINVTTAPFRFLGRLLGRQGDDLEFVSFEAGRSTLLPPEKEKLGKLVEGLKSRPELMLQVSGRFDPVSDAAALRQDKLDALIEARRKTLGAAPTEQGEAVLDRVLDELYVETFSMEAREALRLKHTSAPSPPSSEPAKRDRKRADQEPAPPPPAFDGAKYYEEVRAALLQAQSVGAEDLAALARARAEAIRASLTGEEGIDVTRVTATDVEPIKDRKAGQELVACQLAMPVD